MSGLTQDSVAIIHEQFTRIKLLTTDVHIKNQTIAILQEKLEEADYQVQESQIQREIQERQFRVLQDEYNTMFESSSRKSKSLQAFNQQVAQLQQELNEALIRCHQENEQNRQFQLNIDSLEERLLIKDRQIEQAKEEQEALTINNYNLSREVDNLSQICQSLQLNTEELLFKKSITQNKLCLIYGFVQHLFNILIRMKKGPNDSNQLANYVYYFATMNSTIRYQNVQIDSNKNQYSTETQVIPKRPFRYVIRFVRLLRKGILEIPILQDILHLSNEQPLQFDRNDDLDRIIEASIPKFQEQEQYEGLLSVDQRLSAELYQQLIESLLYQGKYKRNINFGLQRRIKLLSVRDQDIVRKVIDQSYYYEEQFIQLQKRSIQFDELILNLQNEIERKNEQEKSLQLENDQLKQLINTNQTISQNSSFNEQSEINNQYSAPNNLYSATNSGLESTRFRPQLLYETNNISMDLQQELAEILIRKTNNISSNNSVSKIPGRIMKQPLL